MSHKIVPKLMCLLIILLLLNACGSSEKPKPTATPYPTYTALPSLTPYATLTPYPTYTLLPTLTPYATFTPYSTNTPYPTYTPLPTLTPYPTPAPLVVIITATPNGPTAEPTSDGCVRYSVQAGDTMAVIARKYDVTMQDILQANGLSQSDVPLLKIGQVLIIPVPGCALPAVAPTAVSGPVSITNVWDWGKIDTEAVEIRNQGSTIDLQGWTLSSEHGATFQFPEYRMFMGSSVRVFSRQGQNTPIALYWGRTDPVWSAGETATLRDASGQVQATFKVGQPAQ